MVDRRDAYAEGGVAGKVACAARIGDGCGGGVAGEEIAVFVLITKSYVMGANTALSSCYWLESFCGSAHLVFFGGGILVA